MSKETNFWLNVALTFLGVILKDIFKIDVVLFFIVVFWMYLITNTFVSDMHLTKKYIVFLFGISMVYTFFAYVIIDTTICNFLQLLCGLIIGYANQKYFQTEKEYKESKSPFRLRRSAKDLGL